MQGHSFPLNTFWDSMLQYTRDTGNRLQKAQEVLTQDLDTEISSTPYDVEYQEDRVSLKHYKPEAGSQYN